ncbi:MAG: sensor histidine kinase [Bryobacteraceae bacterium]
MLPHLWRVSLAGTRALLGVSSVGVYFLLTPHEKFSVVPLFLIAYSLYGLVALFWKNTDSASHELAALVIDATFFILWSAVSATTIGFWLSVASFAYLLAAAVLIHDVLRVAWVSGTAILFVVLIRPEQGGDLLPVVLLGAALAVIGVLQKGQIQDRLASASRLNVLYRHEAQRAREEERQRIAADFHDGPLQSFISFQMRLEIVKKLLSRDRDSAAAELIQLQDLCKGQVNELRSFVRSMRPPEDGMSLSSSIRRMVEQFQKETGVSSTFLAGDFGDPADTEMALELLQIVREALNNVQKHARATRVATTISKPGKLLEITVEDNGGGFPFSGIYSLDELDLLRLGPLSIKRRVRALAGDLIVESRPGHGAGLKIRVKV